MVKAPLILVVDDSASVRAAVSATLQAQGLRTRAVGGCTEALAAMEDEPADLVLMDLNMEPVRGDACCHQLKAHPAWAHVPVIMLTSADQPHEVMYCWRAAADDFLPKPLNELVLDAKIRATLAAQDGGAPPAVREGDEQVFMAVSSPFLKNVVGGTLEHAGLAVRYARSRQEAERVAADEHPTVRACLVDVCMPEGLDVLELAVEKARARHKAVVALASGELTPALADRARALTGRPVLDRRSMPTDLLVHELFEVIAPDEPAARLRAHERVPFFSVVEFREDEGPWQTGYSYNVSATGIFVRTLTASGAGSRLELQVHFTGATSTLHCGGTVAWANDLRRKRLYAAPLGMGIRLDEVDPVLERHVAHLVQSAGLPA